MAKVVLFLVVMVAIWEASHGLSLCNLKQDDLMACKPAAAVSNPANPSQACCTAINALKANDIQCLCDYKNNEPFMLRSLGVDPARCMQLPALCGSSVPVNC